MQMRESTPQNPEVGVFPVVDLISVVTGYLCREDFSHAHAVFDHLYPGINIVEIDRYLRFLTTYGPSEPPAPVSTLGILTATARETILRQHPDLGVAVAEKDLVDWGSAESRQEALDRWLGSIGSHDRELVRKLDSFSMNHKTSTPGHRPRSHHNRISSRRSLQPPSPRDA